MTTTNQFPHQNGEEQLKKALTRSLTNQLNQGERHFRQTMASQENLAQTAKDYAQRCDQGNAAILTMADEISDQISESQEMMATKSDVDDLRKLMTSIQTQLFKYDHYVVPRNESHFAQEDIDE